MARSSNPSASGGPTAVNATMFTTNTTLASFVGLTWLGDRVRAGFAAPAAVGFVLAVAGAVGVAHYARLTGGARLRRHERDQEAR